MALRIALFIGELRNTEDGSVKTVQKILAHLENQKIPFMVLSPSTPIQWPYSYGKLYKLGALPFPLYTGYYMSVPWQKSFYKVLDAFQPTLIHIGTPCPTGHLGRKYALSRHIPLMGVYHTHFISYFRYYHASLFNSLGYYLMRRFYNSFNRLLVPTQTLIDELTQAGIQAPMQLWNRGVDHTLFNPTGRSQAWRDQIQARDYPIILSVGRLVSEKGISVLAKAYELVKKSHPQSI